MTLLLRYTFLFVKLTTRGVKRNIAVNIPAAHSKQVVVTLRKFRHYLLWPTGLTMTNLAAYASRKDEAGLPYGLLPCDSSECTPVVSCHPPSVNTPHSVYTALRYWPRQIWNVHAHWRAVCLSAGSMLAQSGDCKPPADKHVKGR